MTKKNTFMDLLTSETSNLSVAPNQMIMKKNAREKGTPRNVIAVEPQEYVDKEKVCLHCKSINNCKYKYLNNKMSDQPRYQCLNEDCKKLFTLVLHNRPIGRTYSKKRGEDPIELQGLSKTCPHCGEKDNASFKYYNNDKQKQGLQPRFECLNDNCKKHFQMRKVTDDDGRITLVHASRSLSITRLLASHKQQPQEYNEPFGGTLPTYSNQHMYDANTLLNANEQQVQEYNEFGGMLPSYSNQHMYDVNTSQTTNEQQTQEYSEFGGTLPSYSNQHMYDVNTSQIANEQQMQGTLPSYNDQYMYNDHNIANTLTKNDRNPEMPDVQVREVGRGGLNNQESLLETTQNYHMNGNPSVESTLWGGDFQNGDMFQNGDSEHEINQESHVEAIQDYNQEEEEDNLSIPNIPWDAPFLNGDNFQNYVSKPMSVEVDTKFNWASIEPCDDFCNIANILLEGGD